LSALRRISPYLIHMRLPFQLTLAPIFIWGALLAGEPSTGSSIAAFLSLHLFLYPAATAFNSAYDRDEGPVGGIAAPPEVPRRLLGFALALAALGAGLAAVAGPIFLLLYAAIAGWTAAYSHPALRWKAGPWSSALAIALGQGAIGFAAGWAAVAPLETSAELLAGAGSAALTALGLYPVTQIFQVEEDRARGDRTLAVALGPARALRLGAACLAFAALLGAALTARRFGAIDAALVGAGYAGLVAWQLRLSGSLARDARLTLHARAMRLLYAAATGFLIFLASEAALAA
jgi:4-hydroxybenzoate polyprenyltransferase